MRVGGAGDGQADLAEIETQLPLVLDLRQRVGPQPLRLGVGFRARDDFRCAAGQAQVVDGQRVDGEQRGRRTEFR